MSELVMYPMLTVPPVVEEVLPAPDPLARPVVPADAGLSPAPVYTAEELAELVTLLHPLRFYRNGSWVVLDRPNILEFLRQSRQLWLEDLQDRADAQWRSTGAYRQQQDIAEAEAREAAEDRRYDRQRAERREVLATNRMQQLLDWGLSFPDASKRVSAEFPEED